MKYLKDQEAKQVRAGWLYGPPSKWMTKTAISLGKATYGFVAGFIEGTRSI